MFVSHDGHVTWADMGDYDARGMNLQQVYYNDDEDEFGDHDEPPYESEERNIFTTKAKDGKVSNKVYMNLGDMIETPGGYLATFVAEQGYLENDLADIPTP